MNMIVACPANALPLSHLPVPDELFWGLPLYRPLHLLKPSFVHGKDSAHVNISA